MSDLKTHYVSGEPDTTGREPFEDSGRTGSLGTGPNTQHLSGGIGSGQGLQSNSCVGSGLGGQQDYQNVAPGSAQAHGHQGHHHGHGHGHSHDNAGLSATQSSDYSSGNTSTGSSGAGTAVGSAVGTGASQAVGGEHQGHGHGHGHHHHHSKPSGEGYGGVGAAGTGDHVDRVGPQGQGQAAYERTTGDGPQTRGAAGTDRFDTGSTGAAHGSAENQDTSQRAPGQKSGGISGVLGTSDKDFTGRERQGGTMGAYADSDGPIEGNTSGPKGNTALTGREGNLDNNPVAQAKSRETGTGTASTTTSSHADTNTNTKNDGEHKGLMDKVKDVFKS